MRSSDKEIVKEHLVLVLVRKLNFTQYRPCQMVSATNIHVLRISHACRQETCHRKRQPKERADAGQPVFALRYKSFSGPPPSRMQGAAAPTDVVALPNMTVVVSLRFYGQFVC
ncbi:hypothetical protein RRG08_006590 [Elysia crispata]|uniref:Uncharacterized protein n=1 Tax=Elysia crispata TaxID=231223 RepID=A0AAE0YDQ8_9GAST|nr:hypothetical protein RRG08_006590 [Elysia crispata]